MLDDTLLVGPKVEVALIPGSWIVGDTDMTSSSLSSESKPE